MAKQRTPQELLERATRLVEKFKALQATYEKRAKHHQDRQDFERAAKASKAAERNANLVRKWERARRAAEGRVNNLATMERRAPKPERTEEEPLTEAQKRARERDLKVARLKTAERGKTLSAASVRYDPRTAAGKRTFDLPNMGATMRATVNHFNAVLRWPADRTAVRLLAWQAFDRHYHDVSAGDIPPPKFEPGVDTSSLPGIADARLHALGQDHALRVELGVHLHQLLVEVVYHGKQLRELPGLSELDKRTRTVLLLRALDLVASYWDLDEVQAVRTRVSRQVVDVSPSD